jgi:group I intron endonuclease
MNGKIYLLTDVRNGIQYVGKTKGNNLKYFTGGLIPCKIIKKHGFSVFKRTILEDNISSLEELNKKEIFYIAEYDTFNNGYNLTIGGDGGGEWILLKTKEEIEIIASKKRAKMLNRVFSEDTLAKMSFAKKGIPLTDEHKQHIRESQSGENHPWFGRNHTDETKEKISLKRKGKKSQSHSKWMSENNPNCKSVIIDGIEYKSMTEAAKNLKTTLSVIKGRCKSKHWPNWNKL